MKSMALLFVGLMGIGFVACGRQQPETKEGWTSTSRISASSAVIRVKTSVTKEGWNLSFVSNTGVTESATSERFQGPGDALALSDGNAGQWIVEVFKDTPTAVSEGGRTGNSYPLRRFIVTARGGEKLPQGDIFVPTKLVSLTDESFGALDQARGIALKENKSSFDVMSMNSDVRSSGECFWRFKFYDLKSGEIVGKVAVSG